MVSHLALRPAPAQPLGALGVEHALIGTLIFVVIVVLLVAVAAYVIRTTVPAEFQKIALFIVGALALIAILYRLLPMVA
jgi:hypothetical protein